MITHIIKKHGMGDVPEAVEWTSVCHSKEPCWVVYYDTARWVDRWASVERKRPWIVYRCSKGPTLSFPWSSHKSLDLAVKAIAKAEREETR